MQNWNEGWIDITYPIFPGSVHWPDQPPVKFETVSDIHCGDEARVSILHLSAHSNTHMDAPNHFMTEGRDIGTFPIEMGLGAARVADLDASKEITAADLIAYESRTRPIAPGERLLLRTSNSNRFWPAEDFDYDYLAIGNEAAEWLAKRKIGMVGVDYLSVGPYDTTPATHRALIGAGIWIVEGLDLRNIEEGDYEIICLPLNLSGCDGSPVRALLKRK